MKDKKKESLAAFHKEAIIKEANALFLRKGFAGTTMDDLAKVSGYSKSTIYVYFKSKEDIYQHIIYSCVVIVRDKLCDMLVTCKDGKEFFEEVCSLLIDMHDQNSVFFEGITGKSPTIEKAVISQDILRQTDETREEIHAIILQRLEMSSKKGILRTDIDHLEMVYILWSCIYGIINMINAKADFIETRLKKDKNVLIREGLGNLRRLVVRVKDK